MFENFQDSLVKKEIYKEFSNQKTKVNYFFFLKFILFLGKS